MLILLFVAAFSLSWGPVSWVLPSELVDISMRSRVVSVGTVMNWSADYSVVSTWLSLSGWLGESGSFAFYAIINLASFVFVYICVPETKGLHLEEISSAKSRHNDTGKGEPLLP